MNIEPLRECGFMHVDLDVHELSKLAIGAFLRMLKAHQAGLYKIPQIPNEEKNGTPFGLTRKDRGIKDNVPRDGKYYLHADRGGIFFRELKQEDLLRFDEVLQFVFAAEELLERYEKVAKEILAAFEARYPGQFESIFLAPDGTIPRLTLRFLAYDQPDPWDELGTLATRHFDKSGFTLTGFETGEGLEVETPDGVRVSQPYLVGKSLVMPGELVSDITKNTFPKAWHQVRRGEGALTGPFARFTIVCFCDPLPGTMEIPDERATHGLV